MASITRLIYWLCIGIVVITALSILLTAWWLGQRYSHQVASQQIQRADYFLNAYLQSEETLHTTAVMGVITDFGFRRTVADGDPATITSMLDNHAQRVNLDLLMIADRDGKGLAAYGTSIDRQHISRLYELMKATPESPRLIALEHGFYWLYLSAIKAPHTVGYAIAGTALDRTKLRHIKTITGLDLLIHSRSRGYSLGSDSQLQQIVDPRLVHNDLPSLWQRQPFIHRQLDIASLPADDISVVISADFSTFHQQFDRFSRTLLIVTAILVFIITLISLTVSRRMFMPLESLHKKLLYRASHDPMTGLSNRITANENFHRQLNQAQRTGKPLMVALLDIDHFKQINDSLGHAAGDQVLTEVAQRLKRCLRQYDVLGRFGGEEFIVVTSLPQGDSEGQLQRLKNTIADGEFIYKGNALSLTISIGACFVDFASYKDPLSPGKLLEWADQSLYEAKNKGRNKIVIKHCLQNTTHTTTLD